MVFVRKGEFYFQLPSFYILLFRFKLNRATNVFCQTFLFLASHHLKYIYINKYLFVLTVSSYNCSSTVVVPKQNGTCTITTTCCSTFYNGRARYREVLALG